jgi:hypothetical protein
MLSMKMFMDVVLLLAWIGVSLTVVHTVGHYRRARAMTLGLSGQGSYRAEKDLGLWFAIFLAGTVLCGIAYLATRMFE